MCMHVCDGEVVRGPAVDGLSVSLAPCPLRLTPSWSCCLGWHGALGPAWRGALLAPSARAAPGAPQSQARHGPLMPLPNAGAGPRGGQHRGPEAPPALALCRGLSSPHLSPRAGGVGVEVGPRPGSAHRSPLSTDIIRQPSEEEIIKLAPPPKKA